MIAPRSPDLAAQLLRVRLFGAAGFTLWDNWWYAGHYTLPYSVLFPPLGWLLGPRLLASLAAIGSAASFEALAHRHFGARAWPGATWFGAATATELLSGRLAFAVGLCGALLTALALQRRRTSSACLAALITALFSPVAALFAAVAGAACAVAGERARARRDGVVTAAAALLPIAVIAVVFPQPGDEPFALSALWPIPLIAAVLLFALRGGRNERTLTAGIWVYALGCIAAYALRTPVGGNAARLGVLLAGPLAALICPLRHRRRLLLAILPLLYVQWQGAVRDVLTAQSDPSTEAAYYSPLLRYLDAHPGGPFRIEIPFTRAHWEAYEVAPRVPLARGWERQTDRGENGLLYRRTLTPAAYDAWLHSLAVRFVALPDAPLDPSSRQEATIIRSHPRFLRSPVRTGHWQIYAVVRPTPLAVGTARVTRLGPAYLTLTAASAGVTLVRVRFSPYWQLTGNSGCVGRDGAFTLVVLRHPGRARLTISPWLAATRCRPPRRA